MPLAASGGSHLERFGTTWQCHAQNKVFGDTAERYTRYVCGYACVSSVSESEFEIEISLP